MIVKAYDLRLQYEDMKHTTAFLLKEFFQMSGDKKVRIALNLSKLTQRILKEGPVATKRYYGTRSS
jgi:hypothetical protein